MIDTSSKTWIGKKNMEDEEFQKKKHVMASHNEVESSNIYYRKMKTS